MIFILIVDKAPRNASIEPGPVHRPFSSRVSGIGLPIRKHGEARPLIVAIVGTRGTITGPRVPGNYETSSELVRLCIFHVTIVRRTIGRGEITY